MPPTGANRPVRVLVVRHGQSEWNASGRWQGHADIGLSEDGMRQAAAAVERLGTFDSIWASDLQRAAMTADIIAELLGQGPVHLDARLRETDAGPWQGLTHAEIEEGWPGYLAEHRRPAGFEDYGHAAERALRAVHDIATSVPGGSTVLVISHGGIIRSIRRIEQSVDERIGNLDGTWLEVDGAGEIVVGEMVSLLGGDAVVSRE
jgi:broad specificity phosphatase PhoE